MPSLSGSLYPILAVNFVGTLGFSIVLPFLVFLVNRWGGNAIIYGLAGATYSAFQMVGAPILGRWSDTIGRRKVLLLSQLGTLLSWILLVIAFVLPETNLLSVSSETFGAFSLTLPLIMLFVARALDGLTGGNVSVANAYLADISTDANRSANFGKMAVSSNLGFVIGPAIAGLLAATVWGELLPVLVALLISLVASIMIAVQLPESKPSVIRVDPDQSAARKVLSPDHKVCFEIECVEKLTFFEVFRFRQLLISLVIYFLVMLGFSFFYAAFPMYAVQNLEWSVGNMGIFFAMLSVMMVIVQGPLLTKVSRAVSEKTLVVAGSILLATGFPFLGSSTTVIIYVGVALIALGNGLMWPSVVSILSKSAGTKFQGRVQGMAGSLGAAASILGLILGGLLFDQFGKSIFLLTAVVIFAVFVISFWLTSAPKKISDSDDNFIETA